MSYYLMSKLFIAILLLLGSFAAAAAPDWTTDSKKACKSSELCAVGTGDTRSVSERNARVALSKIFGNFRASAFYRSNKSLNV